jgi:hypothetical protein
MSQLCPNCKLINPPDAIQCDCGYNFVTGEFPVSAIPAKEPVRGGIGQPWSSAATILVAILLVIGGVKGLVRTRFAWLNHTVVWVPGKPGLSGSWIQPWQAALFFTLMLLIGLTWLAVALHRIRKRE